MDFLKRFSRRLLILLLLAGPVAAQDPTAGRVQGAGEPHANYLAAMERYRANVDWRFRDRILSPLREADRLAFTGLSWFPVDPGMARPATFVAAEAGSVFVLPTFDGHSLTYTRHGSFHLEIHGQRVRLLAFRREGVEGIRDFLLVPFRDATNGRETYAGGRYLELDLPLSRQPVLDFNKAASPLCAYDPSYACPIPPRENHLPMAIRAGEKRYR